MKLIITGDFVINQLYDTSKVNQSVIDLFMSSDLNIVNLEAPVTNSNSKIIKTGPHLKANETSTLGVLKTLKIDVVTLANNHLLDYDEQGVKDTITFCDKNDIKTVGAGQKLEDAAKPLFIDSNEGKLAILNFAENEWASATESSAGANPMDIIDNARQIKEAKQQADYVFVIVHGGHEYYNLPSPRMQKQYRFYAEQGADIVIGHHTHCISGNEVHHGVPIFYSLGNFLFTYNSSYKDWYYGLVLEVDIRKGKLSTHLHPVRQQEKTFELSLIKDSEKQELFNRISFYNTVIVDKSKLKQEWKRLIESKYNTYLNLLSPLSFVTNRYIKALLHRIGVKGLNKNGMALSLNLMRCEAHSDISKEVTKRYLLK